MGLIRKAGELLSDLLGSSSQYATIFGLPSYSGKAVTPENSIQVAGVWCSVKIIAETEASLPFQVFERMGDGSLRPANEHPLYSLLHDEPNPEMSAMDFRMAQTSQLALWGNCYARIARNGAGQVIALWPLASKFMQVKRDNSGELVYKYRSGQDEQIYSASDILHVRTLSFDGVNGISPIAQLANPVGLAMALEEFAGRFFGNGAIPAIALQHPGRLGPEATRNIRDSWKKLYGGSQHSHEVAVTEEGMTVQAIGIDPQKSQSVESRKFQVQEIARLYRIPPHMLADLERSSFSNIEQQSLEFVVYTLMPWLELWEQAVNRTLFSPADKQKYFCEHNVAGLLRGDIDSRYSAYSVGRQWGWLSVNDVRRLENMNPIGAEGDEYLVPLNMAPAGTLPDGNSDGNKTPGTPMKAALLALAAMCEGDRKAA